MPTTQYKGYEVQVTGTNTGTWGDVLNDDVIETIDNNLGGIVSKSLSSSNVTLTPTESQMAIVRLTGTLLANVQITTSCVGFFFVENLTSGAFTVTVRNNLIATAVTVPSGMRAAIISDASNGCRIASDTGVASGTTMLFIQTSAPSGWTKSVAHNNKALRIVSGSVSSGGSAPFTTAFASQPVTGTVGNTTLTLSQIPPHRHWIAHLSAGNTGNLDASNYPTMRRERTGSTDASEYRLTGTTSEPNIGHTSEVGSGASHSHGFSASNINLAVQYVDAIIAVKD